MIRSIEQWADKCVSDPRWLACCLSRIGRFGGQHPTCNVLNHSFCLSIGMPTPETQLWAMLHDAHELLTGDLISGFPGVEIRLHQQQADRALLKRLPEITPEAIQYVAKADKEAGDAELESWQVWNCYCDPVGFAARYWRLRQELEQLQKGSV